MAEGQSCSNWPNRIIWVDSAGDDESARNLVQNVTDGSPIDYRSQEPLQSNGPQAGTPLRVQEISGIRNPVRDSRELRHSMTANQFLAAIQPQLTLYGVLLTLTVLFFSVGIRLWRHEADTAKEHTDRLKLMMIGFRRVHIEPLLQDQFAMAMRDSYEDGRKFVATVSPSEASVLGATRDSSYDVAVQDFLASRSGEDFFDKIDARYRGQREILNSYHRMSGWCLTAAYGFIVGSCLLAVGFLRILYPWHDVLTTVWIVASAESILFGIVAVIRFELCRRSLSHYWQDFEIYGQI